MAKELKNINLYATTIMQSKRLHDGIEDSTADMKYMWRRTVEKQTNFFKRRKVDIFSQHTLFEPCCAIINEMGDLEILDNGIPQLQDDGERSIIYKAKDFRASLLLTSSIGQNDIPAWSLTALINLCPRGCLRKVLNKFYFDVKACKGAKGYKSEKFETAIEAAVDAVCWFKKEGFI